MGKGKVLFAVDAGNTTIALGLFRGKTLVSDKIFTGTKNLRDDILRFLKPKVCISELGAVIVSSVVPWINASLRSALCRITGVVPHFLKPLELGMPILCDKPEEVGIDRLLNALAAHHRFKKGAIVVDFGTATTFDIVSPEGEYLGGAIAPGVGISSEALWKRCSRLYPVSFSIPCKAVGKNTSDAMRSGILLGHASMVEGMISRFMKEIRFSPVLVGTGGFASLFRRATGIFDMIDTHLTLKGVKIVYDVMSGKEKG